MSYPNIVRRLGWSSPISRAIWRTGPAADQFWPACHPGRARPSPPRCGLRSGRPVRGRGGPEGSISSMSGTLLAFGFSRSAIACNSPKASAHFAGKPEPGGWMVVVVVDTRLPSLPRRRLKHLPGLVACSGARKVREKQAWQAEVLRQAVRMNRDGDRRAARHFLERELRWMERYARGLAGAEPLLAELVLMLRRVGEEWDERTRKEVFAASYQRVHGEADLRAAAPPSIAAS